MQVEQNTVVTFHYTIKDEAHTLLETSDDNEPITYLHGSEGVLPALQEAMLGKTLNDQITVTLPPEKAYGEYNAELQTRISAKYLRHLKKFKAGDVVPVNTDQGQQWVTVLKKGLKTVDVDGNHPFAGKTLSFVITIEDVREASAEEIDHGHVHGPGGVEH